MAYREFDNFDPASVKQVSPLEGLGEAVARGMAIGQRNKANIAAQKLAQDKMLEDQYKDLAKLDPKNFWDMDAEHIKGKVKNYALEHARGRMSGANPYALGLPQKASEVEFEAGKSQQDKAEYEARVGELNSLKAERPYVNTEVLLGSLNEEASKGLGNRDFKKWGESSGNLVENPNAINIPAFMTEFGKTLGKNTVDVKDVNEQGYTTNTTHLKTDAPNGVVPVLNKKTGKIDYTIPPENEKGIVDAMRKFDPIPWQRSLRVADGFYNEAAKQYVAANGGNEVDIANKMKAGEMPEEAAKYLPSGYKGTPGEIAQKMMIDDFKKSIQTSSQYEASHNVDMAGLRAEREAREAKAKEQVKLEVKPDDSFMAYSSTTDKDGNTTNSNEKRYSIASVNFKKGNTSGVELKGVQLNDVAFDYSTGKFIKPEESPIANRDFTVSRGDVVIRDMSKGGFVKVRSKEEAMRLIGKATNPQDLQIDILYRATVKDEATGTQNSTTTALKTTKDLTTDEQADQNVDVKETTTVSDKSAKKTYGLFGSDVNGHLSAMGVDVQAAIQKQKSYQDISGALKKAQSGNQAQASNKPVALTGKVNPATLKTGSSYEINGKIYTWNGSKLTPQ